MFKTLTYTGFAGHADLLVLAERATPLLADEIRTWKEEVEVTWEVVPTPPDGECLVLELRLKLPNSTGIVRRFIRPQDVADERDLRRACRDTWGRLLDKHLEQSSERLKQFLSTPVEA